MKLSIISFFALVTLSSCNGQSPLQSNENEEVKSSPDMEIFPLPADPEVTILPALDAPHAITRNIIEDRDGNIWFATFSGAVKYDGQHFTNMTRAANDHRYFSILEDQKGNFWFGSIGGGAFYYDGETFANYTKSEGLAGEEIIYIIEDQDGNIWLCSASGLSRFDGKEFRNFNKENNDLPNDAVNFIMQDSKGLFWVGTEGKAATFNGEAFDPIINEEGSYFYNVRTIIEDSRGHIWMGGNDGLWRYDGEVFRNFTKEFVGYIYEDQHGNIWTSSNIFESQGWALSRYDASDLEKEKASPTLLKTGEGMFFGILEDQENNIWVGKLDGVYKYDGKGLTYYKKL